MADSRDIPDRVVIQSPLQRGKEQADALLARIGAAFDPTAAELTPGMSAPDFLRAAYARYPMNPLDPRNIVVGETAMQLQVGAPGFGPKGIETRYVEIWNIVAFQPGKGQGSRAMTEIVDMADEAQMPLTLTAQAYGADYRRGPQGPALVAFYEKFGFEFGKGSDPLYGLRMPQ